MYSCRQFWHHYFKLCQFLNRWIALNDAMKCAELSAICNIIKHMGKAIEK